MELDSTASYKKESGTRLLPTIETYSDTLSDYLKQRQKATFALLGILAVLSIVLLFFPRKSYLLVTIPNALFLLSMAIKADTFERKDQKQRKSIFNLAILKSMIETIIFIFAIHSYWKEGALWNNSAGILTFFTGLASLLYVILGIYIRRKTQNIIQILDLDFYDKELSSYFQIHNI